MRCEWVSDDELYQIYHDKEWGVPCFEDKKLFEMLILEGFQAGLSWLTILKKRENFRKAFDDFNAQKIALYDENKINELMQNSGIVRNRLKIEAAIKNAKGFLEIQKEFGSFSNFLWDFVGKKPIINDFKNLSEVPSKTPLSNQISKELKKRGFNFAGSTIIYAFLQAVGVVNDHTRNCFCKAK